MNNEEKETKFNELQSQVAKAQEEGSGIIDCFSGSEKEPEPVESTQWKLIRIQEEAKAKAHVQCQVAEMDKQIAYTEKIQLRELRIKSFEFAKMLKPDSESSNSGTYDVEKYIADANKIYQQLIK